ncbi:hypothetical protein UPYG_G00118320 [Umbra pygmaea]|uniref:Uncharacterized protein n=1 Tax=Umbra pygmaea TaxID=75934 RepID=A0ABD0XLR9_UMBPY
MVAVAMILPFHRAGQASLYQCLATGCGSCFVIREWRASLTHNSVAECIIQQSSILGVTPATLLEELTEDHGPPSTAGPGVLQTGTMEVSHNPSMAIKCIMAEGTGHSSMPKAGTPSETRGQHHVHGTRRTRRTRTRAGTRTPHGHFKTMDATKQDTKPKPGNHTPAGIPTTPCPPGTGVPTSPIGPETVPETWAPQQRGGPRQNAPGPSQAG